MRVLICGGREWTNRTIIKFLIETHPDYTVIIEGEQRGADIIAREEAEKLGREVLPFPANWDKYGKSAGYRRNKQMLIEGKPDMIVAFHEDVLKSKGTKMMINLALQKKLPVWLYDGRNWTKHVRRIV